MTNTKINTNSTEYNERNFQIKVYRKNGEKELIEITGDAIFDLLENELQGKTYTVYVESLLDGEFSEMNMRTLWNAKIKTMF